MPRGLSRDKIVAVGLEMVNQRGADALTMRGLAQALGVTPMAIYNHFDDKGDLLRAIADQRSAVWTSMVVMPSGSLSCGTASRRCAILACATRPCLACSRSMVSHRLPRWRPCRWRWPHWAAPV
ncbi:helix-turn-helix transcriptional regulator [Mycolicibacterium farcinogenes]|nr:helix-turn-helix transcriptional regulator [Mycolicibacterium farcinogenes]